MNVRDDTEKLYKFDESYAKPRKIQILIFIKFCDNYTLSWHYLNDGIQILKNERKEINIRYTTENRNL